MERASAELKGKTADINAGIESSLSGIRTAKAFANEAVESGKFKEGNRRFVKAKSEYYVAMGRFMTSMECLASVLSVAVIGAGGFFIMRGKMDLVDLVTFQLFITAFINPVRKLSTMSEMFAGGFAGLRRFVDVMRLESSVQDAPDAVELSHVKGDIAVSHVDFSYTKEADVLKDLSFHAKPGQNIAIVGLSGGGKSTLCQLILRFYDVDSGEIRIDGVDVRQVTQDSLRRSIGIVQQDVFLFAATVLENIRYGRPDATLEEVVEAAKKAEIYEDILQMPDGFDTQVGERGVRLSGGHHPHHRPPPVHHPQRQPHFGDAGRPGSGVRYPRRPASEKRPLRRAVPDTAEMTKTVRKSFLLSHGFSYNHRIGAGDSPKSLRRPCAPSSPAALTGIHKRA